MGREVAGKKRGEKGRGGKDRRKGGEGNGKDGGELRWKGKGGESISRILLSEP